MRRVTVSIGLVMTVVFFLVPVGSSQASHTAFVSTSADSIADITVPGTMQPARLGTRVSGGDQTGTSPADAYRGEADAVFDPAASESLDHRWVSSSATPAIWDLRARSGSALVFPSIDHPVVSPAPYESLESTVWGSNDPTAPFPGSWTLASLTRVYADGWTDVGTAAESDDFASLWVFPAGRFRYIAVYANSSMEIAPEVSAENDCSGEGVWCSNDNQIDAVGAPFTCEGQPATMLGTTGPDTLIGTTGADVIVSRGSNDTVGGGSGTDFICAGPGDDLVRGSSGEDTLDGGSGTDAMSGGRGFDVCLSGEDLTTCEQVLPDFGTGFGTRGTGTCIDTSATFQNFDLSTLPTHRHRPFTGEKFDERIFLQYGPIPVVNVLFTITSAVGDSSAVGSFNASSGTVTVSHGLELNAGDSVHVVASWIRPATFLSDGRHWGFALESAPELPAPIPQVGSFHYDFTVGEECG
jgi:hemolysin type calcium-binding protein